MLKKAISILLLIVLVFTGSSRYWVYLGYRINRQYIAKNLCVNRSRPQLHCNGKCVLTKQLKQVADNEEKQEEQNVIKKIELDLILQQSFILKLTVEYSNAPETKFQPNCSFKTGRHISDIFHPPQTFLPLGPSNALS